MLFVSNVSLMSAYLEQNISNLLRLSSFLIRAFKIFYFLRRSTKRFWCSRPIWLFNFSACVYDWCLRNSKALHDIHISFNVQLFINKMVYLLCLLFCGLCMFYIIYVIITLEMLLIMKYTLKKTLILFQIVRLINTLCFCSYK